MVKTDREYIADFTKLKIGVVACHNDDEFIGCHRIFEIAGNNITQVVYFTDSSLQTVFREGSTSYYIRLRGEESQKYRQVFAPNSEHSLLEIPDGLSAEEYQKKCFPAENQEGFNNLLVNYLQMDLEDCDVIFCPIIDSLHPSHIWCNEVCIQYAREYGKPIVWYYTHQLFSPSASQGKPYSYFMREISSGYFYSYFHPEGAKSSLFKSYFNSQYIRFHVQNIKLYDHEQYFSNFKIDLTPKSILDEILR